MMVGDKAALYSAKRESGIDASAVAPTWAECRGKEGGAWLLVGFDDAVKDKIVVRGSGDGGFAELSKALADAPAQILFGALPFTDGVSGATKWAFLTHVGTGVSALKKGKVSLQKAGVYNAFEGVVADVGILSSPEDETADAVLAALRKATGKGGASLL